MQTAAVQHHASRVVHPEQQQQQRQDVHVLA